MRKPENEMQKLNLKVLERERERLFSKIPGDPIVEILRGKKESCSTHLGLRVDTSFGSFRQTP